VGYENRESARRPVGRARGKAALARAALLVATATAATATAAPPAGQAAGASAKKRQGLRESLRGPAREAFEHGVVLFEAKNPSGAFVEFERAYELSKDPRLLFNMALADRDQRRFARAVDLLQRELAEGEGVLRAEEMSLAGRALGAFLPFTTLVTVTCDQPGATVLVDDVPVGTTPLSRPVRVDVGERRIVARKEGFRDALVTRHAAGDTPLAVTLTLDRRGKLVVHARGAASAKIAVDGVEVGSAPWEGNVPVGERDVTISADGFVSTTRRRVIAPDALTILEVALRPDRGRVRVLSDAGNNVIAIDGKPVGKGSWDGSLRSGPHSLLVRRGGAEPYSAEFTVLRDQTRTLQVNLRSRPSGWYWYVGGGVLLVGAATTAVLVLSHDSEPSTTGSSGSLEPNRAPTGIFLPPR
jgi:PEGA domain